MAKRRGRKDDFPTLNRPVPTVVGFTILVLVFLVAVKLVQKVAGMGY